MRSDIVEFIASLHAKDQKVLLGSREINVETIERRMPPDATVYAVLAGSMIRAGTEDSRGVALLSSFGVHWSASSYYEWPWEQVSLISDAGNYRATILLAGTNERVDFNLGEKWASCKHFSDAVALARERHTPQG
jgi:hypothetical protein